MVLSFFHHSGYLPVNSKLERIITWKIQINGAFFQKKTEKKYFDGFPSFINFKLYFLINAKI